MKYAMGKWNDDVESESDSIDIRSASETNERSSDKAKENNKSLCLSSSNNIANNNCFFDDDT